MAGKTLVVNQIYNHEWYQKIDSERSLSPVDPQPKPKPPSGSKCHLRDMSFPQVHFFCTGLVQYIGKCDSGSWLQGVKVRFINEGPYSQEKCVSSDSLTPLRKTSK